MGWGLGRGWERNRRQLSSGTRRLSVRQLCSVGVSTRRVERWAGEEPRPEHQSSGEGSSSPPGWLGPEREETNLLSGHG